MGMSPDALPASPGAEPPRSIAVLDQIWSEFLSRLRHANDMPVEAIEVLERLGPQGVREDPRALTAALKSPAAQ